MNGAPEFRFDMWAVQRHNDPYYYTNWDKKIPITVVAPNQSEAINKAKGALGAPRDKYYWIFQVRSITDHKIHERATDEQ